MGDYVTLGGIASLLLLGAAIVVGAGHKLAVFIDVFSDRTRENARPIANLWRVAAYLLAAALAIILATEFSKPGGLFSGHGTGLGQGVLDQLHQRLFGR